MSQSSISTSSHGTPTRRPSGPRPALMAMQSSPTSNTQPVITTERHDSGSQPSLLGPREWMDTFLTSTFSHRTGWISHMGERTIRTPSTSTLRHRYGWIMFGRR